MTLIEALIALMILSLVSLALMQNAGQQVRHLNLMEKKYFASLIAENHLSVLTLSGHLPENHWLSGTVRLAGEEWYWQSRGRVTSDKAVRGVDVEVRDAQGGQPQAVLKGWMIDNAAG